MLLASQVNAHLCGKRDNPNETLATSFQAITGCLAALAAGWAIVYFHSETSGTFPSRLQDND